MWTTREWYVCLERMSAYERRVVSRQEEHGGASKRGIESDAENTGLEQYVERYTVRPRTERQFWFWYNHY